MTANNTAIVNVSSEAAVALDLEHLNASTFGDRMLRAEIIALFNAQLEQSREHLLRAATAQDWRFLTHTLKGAAGAVGAVEIAQLAERWENEALPELDRSSHIASFDLARTTYLSAVRVVLG